MEIIAVGSKEGPTVSYSRSGFTFDRAIEIALDWIMEMYVDELDEKQVRKELIADREFVLLDKSGTIAIVHTPT